MAQAYRRILTASGLTYRAVAADSGAIGGDLSESFQVIAATGEDAIVYCPGSDYAANMEKAEALAPRAHVPPSQAMAKDGHPGQEHLRRCGGAAGSALSRTVKSLVLATDTTNEHGEIVKRGLAAVAARRPRHDEIKVGKVAGLDGASVSRPWRKLKTTLAATGYLGPIGLQKPVKIVVDREVAVMADWFAVPTTDFHITGVNWGRDLPKPDAVADLPTWWRAICPGRQGRAGNRARHRSGPCVLSGHQVQPRDERDLPGRERQTAAL